MTTMVKNLVTDEEKAFSARLKITDSRSPVMMTEKQYRMSDRLARIPSKVIFTILLQVDVKRLMDKNCHSSFSFLKNNRLLLAYVFPKKVALLITAKQNVFL